MRIVKLNAIDSTNSYLKGLMQTEALEDFTVVVANHQNSGRGQMGSKWTSEPGKNLIMSVLKIFNDLPAEQQFSLNVCVSLAVFDTLKSLEIPKLSIKWPNDILSGNRKIGGILIENSLLGTQIRSAIIGLGLNVNQTDFVDLPNASSLKLIMDREFDLDQIQIAILRNLQQRFLAYQKDDTAVLWSQYEASLFGKDNSHSFMIEGGQVVLGRIEGISAGGKLNIVLENGALRSFGLKEIKLLL